MVSCKEIMLNNLKYESLGNILIEAFNQASEGKGKERHANELNFEQQPIIWIGRNFKSFTLGQAVKKCHESQKMEKDAAIRELYGAINYIAAEIIIRKGE